MTEKHTLRTQRVGRIKDARGKVIKPLDPYELNLLRQYSIIPEDDLRPITAQVGFGLPGWQRLGYLACVATFLGCIVFLVFWKVSRGTSIDAMERVLWPVNLIVFAFGAIQFWLSGRRARARLVCAVMLQYHRCPHCGYDIRGLPTDPQDETTICPECGCAWKLETSGMAQREDSDVHE